MATLTVRNLPDAVHDALRRRAAEHRRSVEAEVRETLAASVRIGASTEEGRAALARLRGMRPLRPRAIPKGWSETDEVLAEKHLEAAWEAEQVSAEERDAWLDRLGRFEVWPREVEAFVTQRIARE
jgi:plasmid stability protein